MFVRLSNKQIALLIDEVKKIYPIEACGVLFGVIKDEEMHLKKIVPLRNVIKSESMFQIDPEDFLKILIVSEAEGLQHIGFFHSHPGNVKPSEIDLKYMKLWPESIWLIISSLNYEIAAYQIVNEHLREVPVEIE
ncbi:MAG: M67 family metallopeptidase [Candidatus Bathyarchaeia archaeon]